MDKFGYPTNIKQIGDVDNDLRIYIEDYVYSYLLQYAESGGNDERLAALVGRCMLIDGQTVLFINGAIQGKYCESDRGILSFSNNSLEYIDNQINKYFKGLEVVGWLQSQPNYGNFLSASYAKYHIDNFKKPYQVMFVTDPIEKINSFFIWNNDKSDIIEANGFFIFYDKNKNMHNYILDNKIVKFSKPLPTEVLEQPIDEFIDEDDEDDEKPSRNSNNYSSKYNNNNNTNKTIRINKNDNNKKFKIRNISTSVASFLFIITIFMGANLISSNNRINKLEGDISNIRTAYNDLVTYVNNQSSQPVFAANTDSSIAQTEVVVEPVTTPNVNANETENNSETSEQEENVKSEVKPTTTIEKTYTIRQGDSLISICRDVYGSDKMLDKLMEANNITDPNKIYYGMVIKLPDQN